jgi:HSP90 family molecular chaperone
MCNSITSHVKRYPSSHSSDQLTGLEDYVSRMKKEQVIGFAIVVSC